MLNVRASMRPLLCLCVFVLCLGGPARAADDDDANAPPPLDGAPAAPTGAEDPNDPTPGDSATADVHVQVGDAEATLFLLNPNQGGAPLWLWIKGSGPAASSPRRYR